MLLYTVDLVAIRSYLRSDEPRIQRHRCVTVLLQLLLGIMVAITYWQEVNSRPHTASYQYT